MAIGVCTIGGVRLYDNVDNESLSF